MDKEQKRLQSVVMAAAFLQHCFPPHKQSGAARSIAMIAGPQADNAVLEILLEGSTQRLTPVGCPNPACERQFLYSEANREGDSYRCVWCNKAVFSDGTFAPPLAPLPRHMRALERALNVGFIDYCRAYFGQATTSLCNVYVGMPSLDGVSPDESTFSVTVLIRKIADPDAAAATGAAAGGDAASSSSVWNSSHSIAMQLDRDYQIDVLANSTIYLESQAAPCRFSGHVDRKTKKFAVPIPDALHPVFEQDRHSLHRFVGTGGDAARQLVVAAVGNLVQQVENRLRDQVASIAFIKTGQVCSDLRCPVGRTDSAAVQMGGSGSGGGANQMRHAFPQVDSAGLPIVARAPVIPVRQAPDVPITASVPLPPKRSVEEVVPKHQQQEQQAEEQGDEAPSDATAAAAASGGVYTEEVDEEGNVYYLDEATGEAVWELPDGAEVKQKKSKKDKKDKKGKKSKREAEEVDATAAAEADAGEEWTVAGVLAGLELTEGTADEYAALLAEGGAGTVEEMLQLDDKALKKMLGKERSADRKVIAAWINDTYAVMVGEQAEE